MQVQLTVNGKAHVLDLTPNTLLVQALREDLHLTGTHVGCDTAQCGACTVIADGQSVKSCNVLAAQISGASVTTIEGLTAPDGTMHPMQVAFKDCHGLQCGFCSTGMVLSAVDLCTHHPQASETEIRELLEGNICRCTGYQNIVRLAVTGGGKGVFHHAGLEAALAKAFTPKAAAGVPIDAGDMNGDIHGSAAYRAHLVGVMAQRAFARALG